MRIVKYETRLDENRIPVLVKEKSQNYPEEKLNNPQKIVDMMNSVYHANICTEEYVWLLALNGNCKLIGTFEVSHGLMDASLVSPRETFIKLLLCGANKFVLVHNHPSGNCYPSTEDKKTTERMRKAGELMNITMIDHIIIGDDYYSFQENN